MTENKRFSLMESTYNDIKLVIDDNKGKFTFSALPKHKAVNYCTVLNKLADENEQLQSRNQRQAKHLAELYELIAKKDWNSLTEIIDDLCSCEADLDAEWKCYE